MANAAIVAAPKKEGAVQTKEQIALSQEFDTEKKYMFELIEQNPQRELPPMEVLNSRATPMPHARFKPFQNMVMTSQIIWNGQRRMLRYYDGCTSIFVDEQPKDKETIDQLIKQTDTTRYNFLMGKVGFFGDERMLLLYLSICGWNGESLFRTKTSQAIFRPSNSDKQATIESNKLDQQEEALKLAKEATDTKMFIHAHYLGIPVIDYDSGNDLTLREVRTAYRKEALSKSQNFIESYGNKAIELRYYINKALTDGVINNKFNANIAAWGKSNAEICDISGLRTQEGIAEKLLEFSQLEEGQEFSIQLKALYN